MIINFGSWLPDQPSLSNPCKVATNVYPSPNGYGPFYSALAVGDALVSAPVGRIGFQQVSGKTELFVGTSTRLYRKNGTSWDDVSQAAYSPSTFWRFAVYGDLLIATNGIDRPQKFTLSTGSAFEDLANAPTHNFPIVVRDTLVALDVTDGSGFEVKWSVNNNAEDWTAANGGGSQSFPDGANVVGGTGGEYGVILQAESGLTRMNFVGGDLRFTFDKIEGGTGCIAADSIVQYKGRTFYLSDEGFQLFDGAESTNISDEICSNYFFSQLAEAENLVTDTLEFIITDTGEEISIGTLNQVEGDLDQSNSCVVWKFPTATGNQLLIFNFRLNRWSLSTEAVEGLHHLHLVDGPVLSGFDSDNKLVHFNGAIATATVSTGDMQLVPDTGCSVRTTYGLVDSAHDITIGKKSALLSTEATVSGSSNSNGKVTVRSHGRYHRFQVVPTATYTEIIGVDVEFSATGRRV